MGEADITMKNLSSVLVLMFVVVGGTILATSYHTDNKDIDTATGDQGFEALFNNLRGHRNLKISSMSISHNGIENNVDVSWSPCSSRKKYKLCWKKKSMWWMSTCWVNKLQTTKGTCIGTANHDGPWFSLAAGTKYHFKVTHKWGGIETKDFTTKS